MTTPNEISDEAKQIATAVGSVCLAWSALEFLHRAVLFEWLGSASIQLHAIGNLPQRNLCDTVLSVGYEKSPNDEWFDELKKHINYVNGNLRLMRNDYVHNVWVPGPSDDFELVKIASKVKNVQSRTRRLEHFQSSRVQKEDLLKLETAIRAEAGPIQRLNEFIGSFGPLEQQLLREQLPPRNLSRD